MPNAFDSVPSSFNTVPSPFDSVPTSFDSVPNAYDSVSVAFDSVLAAFDLVPAAFDSVPTAWRCMQYVLISMFIRTQSGHSCWRHLIPTSIYTAQVLLYCGIEHCALALYCRNLVEVDYLGFSNLQF